MYSVQQEYFEEENHRCSLCNKCINRKYIMLVEPDERRYFHLICYKYLMDLNYI